MTEPGWPHKWESGRIRSFWQNAANPEYWPEDVTFISRAARAGAIEIEKAINIHRSVHKTYVRVTVCKCNYIPECISRFHVVYTD
mgnify:FL=1